MPGRLSEIAELYTGVAPKRSPAGEARFLQIRDLSLDPPGPVSAEAPGVARAVTVRQGDVLIAARGEPAPVALASRAMLGCYVSADLYLVRPVAERLDSAYLAAFLRRPATQAALRAATAGTLLPRIAKPELAGLEIPLPPLSRQRTIGLLAQEMDRRERLIGRRLDLERRWRDSVLNRVFEEA